MPFHKDHAFRPPVLRPFDMRYFHDAFRRDHVARFCVLVCAWLASHDLDHAVRGKDQCDVMRKVCLRFDVE